MLGYPTGFWGKLERDGDGAVREWHPLADHCLDVACVTEALLTRSVLGARLAHLADRVSLGPSDVARLAVLAALHDLGKFNHGFQAKAEPGAQARTGGHVGPGAAHLWTIDPTSAVWGKDALGPLLAWADDALVVRHLLLASVGHHGRPVAKGASQGDWSPRPERDPIAGVVALVARCRATFPAAFAESAAPLPTREGFQHAFAGLVMLADWLGSDAERWFPYSATADRDYGVVGRRRARAAVTAVGLDVESVRRGPQAHWSVILPAGARPRALQAAAADLKVVAAGGVEVFEAETGAGKTEAALLRFAQLFAAGAVDGLYFALPTRTAATQLHGRIQAAVDRLWGRSAPEVVLAVPGYLQAGAHTGQQLPGYRVLWPDDPSAARDGRRWAAEGPKRFLCATIAVGTIDQVLLAGLEVNHSHLRATALMRSYLVVDEVHASDVYMTTILRRVLRFHVAACGHALLLSATLGEAMRASLAAPLRRQGARSLGDAMAVPYPALHVGTSTTAIASDGRDKAVTMELCAAAEDPTRIAALAGAAARAGAHVLVIRNLVSDAVATQRALEAELADAPELLLRIDGKAALHHSRFATPDRAVLDAAIERGFGKGRPVEGKVAVATQTVQQSLDLDADLLITDLSPADVLLQRIGRLHRHDGPRPVGFATARCVVLGPGVDDLGDWLDARGRVRRRVAGLGSVYEDLRMAQVCLELVSAQARWAIPSMNRELVERGTHPDALDAISGRSAAWAAHGMSTLGAELARSGQARTVSWAYDAPFGDCQFGGSDIEGKIKTRLGADDRVFRLEPSMVSPFGHVVDRIQVPGWLCRGVAVEIEVAAVEAGPGSSARIVVGGLTLRYDRLGLRLAGDPDEGEELDG